MKGFVLYPTYRASNDGSYVWLFGRLENGQSFLSMNKYEPYFYIKEKDAKNLLKKASLNIEKTNFKNFKNEKVSKIILEQPKEVSILRNELEEKGIECYEADIRFAYRYLIDKEIMMSIEIDGEYENGEFVDRIYYDASIVPCNFFPKLKIFSIDIETSKNFEKLYSIAIYSKNFEKVLMGDEEDMLEEFKKIIIEEDPDIITGWNLIDFDLMVLKNKFKEHNIPFNLGRVNESCKIKLESNFFRDSKADFPGRIVLDGISLLRMNFIKLNSFKLDNVAKSILNKKKLIDFTNKGEEIEKLFNEDKEKLKEYNLHDAKLVYEILEKIKAIDMVIEKSILTGMPLDRVNASIASLDSLYLRELKKRGFVAPSGSYSVKEERIKGGYVMESKPGIYDNVLVLDFKSLYPSMMQTFNIDPLNYVEDCKGKDLIIAPNGACFKNNEGIIGKIIERLLIARDKSKKEGNELQRWAIKILLNSMFGVLANPNCRFFNLNIANAITHFGQNLIKLTAKKISEECYEVIYSDTDSCFVLSKAKNLEEAEKIGKELNKKLNNFFKEFVKKEYNRESKLILEYEKCFTRFLMPKIRGGEEGAKKRYAGLNSNGKIEIVGLEAIRGDWTELAKKFQIELLEMVFNKKEVKGYIKKFVNEVRKGKYDELLIYRKNIRKSLEEYRLITPPHVKAARKLNNFQGSVIEYIMTEDGPEPIQALKNKVDYKHYIDKQIKPIADSILNFFDLNFDELIEGSKQKNLFSYT